MLTVTRAAAVLLLSLVAAPPDDASVWRTVLSDTESFAHAPGDAPATAPGRRWRARLVRLRDPALRARSLAFLPDLEATALRRRQGLRIEAELRALHGELKWSPGGPDWLRALAGDDAMAALQEVTELSLADKQDPHSKDFHRNTAIDDAWVERLVGLRSLRRLDLGTAELHGPGLKAIGTLTSLEVLNLTLCPLGDDALAHLAGLTELRALIIASTKVTGAGWRHLGRLTKLENLNAHSCPIDDEGLSQVGSRLATAAAVAPLASLPALAELDLSDRQATPAGIAEAARIPTLRLLRVPRDAHLDKDIEVLRQRRPEVAVNP